MGTYLKIISGDMHPDNAVNFLDKPLILNDLSVDKETHESLMAQTAISLNGDLEITPSCRCGYTTDSMAMGNKNTKCVRCHDTVSDALSKPIIPTVFIRTPKGVDSLLLPIFVSLFQNAFYRQSFDIFRYLTNSRYKGNEVAGAEVIALGYPRDINYFTNNLLSIMEGLKTIRNFTNKDSVKDLIELYKRDHKNIHCKHVYLLNKQMNVLDSNALGTWTDNRFATMTDAALNAVGIDIIPRTEKNIKNLTGKILATLATFYSSYIGKVMGAKEGAIRTQIYNARGSTMMRCVAVSLTTNLKHPAEVHVPYTGTLYVLYPQIIGKLFKEGMTHREATNYIHKHTHVFSKKLYDYMNACMFEDSAVTDWLIGRFPSLSLMSLPVCACTTIKPEVTDKAISVSGLGLTGSNLDFDGDQLNAGPTPDIPEFKRLRIENTLLDTQKPRTLSRNVYMTDPVVGNVSIWHQESSLLIKDPVKEKEVLKLLGV